MNSDHAIGVGFCDMAQFVKVGRDEIGPALAQDTEDFRCPDKGQPYAR